MTASDAFAAAQRAAREAYGRLVAVLARDAGDLAAAEDALGDAFERALATWPRDGVPQVPTAWLLTAARRRLLDQRRHDAVAKRGAQKLLPLLDAAATRGTDSDRRLDLLFVCAHPAIDRKLRAPLMLQSVLGLTAEQMSAAFAVSPAALGQRLARAKRRLRKADVPFDVPEGTALDERLGAVLDALYAAFGTGWDDAAGARDLRHGLAGEALYLARLVAARFAESAEAHGLVALMLFAQSRRDARRDADGRFVPLSAQDCALWDSAMIDAADAHLAHAASLKQVGRYQLEAAIQAQYARPPADPEAVALLYEGLVREAPSLASFVGRAAALGEARGAAAGLAASAAS
ncbi:MAG: DUF6596 domain-containing protein, partial [Pseudomonadota bacterium]